MRWYASKAAAKRAHRMLVGERGVSLVESGTLTVGLRFYECVESCPFTGEFRTRTVRVTYVPTNAGFVRRVDRLARDWIAHGVTPCEGGNRGVKKPWCACPPQAWWQGYPADELPEPREIPGRPGHLRSCPALRWRRAEARARRVVRR